MYGLNDASRTWYFRVRDELIQNNCKQSEIDPALFCCFDKDKLVGMFLIHVDDFIWSGAEQFRVQVITKFLNAFEIGKQGMGDFRYIGLQITQHTDHIMMDQDAYIEGLMPIGISATRISQKQESLTKDEISQLRSVIGQLNWIANQTRPDVCFDNLELSVSIKDPKVEDIIKANKVIKKLHYEQNYVCFPKLGKKEHLRLTLFSDASYANLSDGASSAGGFIIFLHGEKRMSCPLAWKANKIRRVVRSTLAAETLSLVDALDTAVYLGHLLSEVLFNGSKKNVVPIDCYIDNKSLHDNIYSTKLVAEKRLRIDIASIKQMMQKGEISQVIWVDTSCQISDCLTKRGASNAKLMQVIKEGVMAIM